MGGFPEGETVQEQLFGNVAGRNRLCSHSRTFWPWVLKNQAATASVELALDFDTDIILLQPIEKLWGYFQNFTGSTLLSMAQCDNW